MMTKYTMGAEQWPGLAKVNEEAGEVIQVIGKLMMREGDVRHWSGNLQEMLEDEVADLIASLQFLRDNAGLNEARIDSRIMEKSMKFNKWRDEERANALLEALVVSKENSHHD